MPDGFDINFDDMKKLAASLGDVPREASGNVRKAVAVTARKVNMAWREKARGASHAPAFSSSITYDITGGDGIRAEAVQAEIGPDKDRRQGALGNLIEFGSVNNAPRGYGLAALQENEADFEKGLTIALADAEKAAGL